MNINTLLKDYRSISEALDKENSKLTNSEEYITLIDMIEGLKFKKETMELELRKLQDSKKAIELSLFPELKGKDIEGVQIKTSVKKFVNPEIVMQELNGDFGLFNELATISQVALKEFSKNNIAYKDILKNSLQVKDVIVTGVVFTN